MMTKDDNSRQEDSENKGRGRKRQRPTPKACKWVTARPNQAKLTNRANDIEPGSDRLQACKWVAVRPRANNQMTCSGMLLHRADDPKKKAKPKKQNKK